MRGRCKFSYMVLRTLLCRSHFISRVGKWSALGLLSRMGYVNTVAVSGGIAEPAGMYSRLHHAKFSHHLAELEVGPGPAQVLPDKAEVSSEKIHKWVKEQQISKSLCRRLPGRGFPRISQWLGVHPVARLSWIRGSRRIPRAAGQLSRCAATTEPVCEPQTREATAMKTRALQPRRPHPLKLRQKLE